MQVCNFCISEAFNEIKSKHFSNAWRYSSLCVISCTRQSVAQKLDKIHFFYAHKFCRPTSGVRVLKQSCYSASTECVWCSLHQKRVNIENAIIMTVTKTSCSTEI